MLVLKWDATLKIKNHVKIIFANKVIMFEKIFGFKNVIILYYGRGKSMALQHKVFKAQVWAIAGVITTTLNFVGSTCVLN
jgi:hypothetical protein